MKEINKQLINRLDFVLKNEIESKIKLALELWIKLSNELENDFVFEIINELNVILDYERDKE